MKATRAAIDTFLSSRRLAVAGVSRNPKKFGHIVFKTLTEKGFEIFPVNPEVDVIDRTPCFRNVASLPVNVHNLLIVTPKKLTAQVVSEALAKGIDNIWIQQGVDTPEALNMAKSGSVNLISGECILMHAGPVTGIHRFHRTLRSLFGKMPK